MADLSGVGTEGSVVGTKLRQILIGLTVFHFIETLIAEIGLSG